MAVRVAGLAFGGRAEHGRHVVEAFDVGLGCEIEVAAIRLGLAGEGVLEILFGLAALEIHGTSSRNIARESRQLRLNRV